MNVTFSGGTTQQRDWVTTAIDGCTYPLATVPAHVTVEWVSVMPVTVDTRHPYMATHIDTPGPGGTYHVYIMDWADDPTNTNNSGLPHPATDIQDYYQQSVVHECGHIVCFETFDPGDTIFTATGLPTAPDVADACACFFKLVNGARQYGTGAQWSEKSLAWGDEIRESVAEVFKVAFYGGRLIFGNRTNWKVDPARWNRLMTHIPAPDTPGFPPGTLGPPTGTKHATASLKLIDIDLWGGGRYSPTNEAWGLGVFAPDAPYDESQVRLLLLSSSGDAEWSLLSQDDGRYTATLTFGSSSVVFTDATRPVWLWLVTDFEAGTQTGRLTADSAGTEVLFEHTYHCGPQPAAVFTTELYAGEAVVVKNRLAVTDWKFSAPGQSPPSVGLGFGEDGATEHFPLHEDLTLHYHVLEGEPTGWVETDGELTNFSTGPFGRQSVRAMETLGLSIGTTVTGALDHGHYLATADLSGAAFDLDPVDDGPISFGPVDEEWWLCAVKIGLIVGHPALGSVQAYDLINPPTGGTIKGPLNVQFWVQFDGRALVSEVQFGAVPNPEPIFLPSLDTWFYEGASGLVGGVDPTLLYFGRQLHWSRTGGGEILTGLWGGLPPTTPQTPPATVLDTTPVPPGAVPDAAFLGPLPTLQVYMTVLGDFGLSDLPMDNTLFTWDIGPAITLEWYRGQKIIDLKSIAPTKGPLPVPVSPPAPGLTLVGAGPPQGGAAVRSRPTSGVQAEAARLVLP